MDRSPNQFAENSARVAAARLVPTMLVRGLLIILACEAVQTIVMALRGHPHNLEQLLLGWVVLATIGLPALYLSSLKPVAQAVAGEFTIAANARFENVLAQVRDGVMIYDENADILYCNPAAEHIHGYPRGSLVGRSLETIVPEKLRPVVREDFALFRATGTGLVIGKGTMELESMRADGQPLFLEVSAAQLKQDGRKQVVTILRDATERRRTEKHIARLARTSALNPNPVLECAPDGSILYANPGAQALMGAIPSAASILMLIPRFAEVAARCAKQSAPVTGVETSVRGRTLLWTLQMTEEKNSLLVYGTDITERKCAEEALQLSERQVIELLDTLAIGVKVIINEKTVFANAAAAKIHGYSSARELIGLDAVAQVSPKDLAKVKDYHRRRMAGEEVPNTYELNARRKDGSETPIELSATRFFYEGHAASLLVMRDLSDEKRLKMYEQILPVCCMCGKIRDDSGAKHGEGAWGRLDHYVMRHSNTQLSHTFCPACFDQYRKEQGLG